MGKRVGSDGLTDEQRRFVAEYLLDLDPKAAARRAGFPRVPHFYKNNQYVAAAIQAGLMIETDRYEVSRDNIMKRLATVAFSDVGQVLSTGPDGIVFHDLSKVVGPNAPNARAVGAIAEVAQEIYTEGPDGPAVKRTRVKMADPKWALEMLVKMNSLAPAERLEVTGKDGAPLKVENSVDLSGLSVEELEMLHRISQRISGDSDEE